MVIIILDFYSLACFFRYRISKYAVKLSRPEVGSSRTTTLGFDIISNPILVLFLSPPDIPLIKTPPTKLQKRIFFPIYIFLYETIFLKIVYFYSLITYFSIFLILKI